MSAVHLPDDLVKRLAAEAARRGVTVDELVTEMLAARFPADHAGRGRGQRRLSFAGIGSSGPAGGDIARRHKEIRGQHFSNKRAADA